MPKRNKAIEALAKDIDLWSQFAEKASEVDDTVTKLFVMSFAYDCLNDGRWADYKVVVNDDGVFVHAITVLGEKVYKVIKFSSVGVRVEEVNSTQLGKG